MESGRNTQWKIQWCCFLILAAVLTVVCDDLGAEPERVDVKPPSQTACVGQRQKRSLVMVSTLDGKVSALDLNNQGNLDWSMDAGPTPLLSSSISNLEILRNGVKTRLIPSLDGALYQFDGESIQALPFTADNLLSSSFKFTDDSTIVGGKESIKYGINPKTGQVHYVCAAGGCTQYDSHSAGLAAELDDMIVITRHTKTVRAVEMMLGHEKWNFSVGQHEIFYVRNGPNMNHITDTGEQVEGDEDAHIYTCADTEEEEDDWYDFSWLGSGDGNSEVEIKVVVPQGRVIAISRNDPDQILWQHKFDSAIARAWMLQDEEISEVNLFDETHVPALEIGQIGSGESGVNEEEAQEEEVPQAPLLYIGLHENQMYVQPSVQMTDDVQQCVDQVGLTHGTVDMPRVAWRPYLATAPSRTPLALGHRNPLQITQEEKGQDENGLTVWHEEYPFDGGYYLFPDTTPLDGGKQDGMGNQSDYILYNVVMTGSLWLWWKEVTLISIVTSVAVHVLITRCVLKHKLAKLSSSSQGTTSSNSSEIVPTATDPPTESRNNSESENSEFHSRYYGEFTQKECLGRGGFGVVFEASNNMDDISYAIKRITLNKSEKAKLRVMREVKALAMLDHSNIVRYYQAWFESPPPGWQEERDKHSMDLSSTMPSTNIISSATSNHDKNNSPKHQQTLDKVMENDASWEQSQADEIGKLRKGPLNPFGLKPEFNPLRPFGGADSWNSSQSEQSESAIKRQGSTGPFYPQYAFSQSDSDSHSLGTRGLEQDNSLSIEFRDSENEVSQSISQTGSLPFDGYDKKKQSEIFDNSNDSFSIVFEDSGCGEKSEKSKSSSYDLDIENLKRHDVSWTEREEDSGSKSLSRSPDKSKSFSVSPPKHRSESSFPSSGNVFSKNERPTQLELMDYNYKPTPENMLITPTPTSKLYLYIQMQLCRRESLKDWLNSNTLNRDRLQLLDIFDQIVCAVDYIHDSGLMHRDLKPSNIFFSPDGIVKVGDFGLVTALEEQHQDPFCMQSGDAFYKHTDQVGTKLYMSPEQVAGKMYDHKVDIYSLGLIFFEMFYPFATQMERIKSMLDVHKLIFPPRFARELPDECDLVRNLLNPKPEERPSTKKIQQHLLLKDFEAARQLVSRIRPRTRTMSTSSSQGSSL